jgi:3alpha(or 20beta)-hydroxysteroid dehydrogenase
VTDVQGTKRLATRIAIVTGAARGLGASIAMALHHEGAQVVLADVRDTEGAQLAASLGARARFAHLDVSSEADWQATIAATCASFGNPNVLINNAGIYLTTPLEQTTLAEYMRVIGINQVGCFLGMRSCLAAMRAAGGGSIVNIASTAGIEGLSNALHYTASKHAVVGMTRTAALELGASGIRVNAVCPGALATPLLAESYGTGVEQLLAAPFPNSPLGRMGRPEEVARTVVLLASEESSYTTGSIFVVDGGISAGTITS